MNRKKKILLFLIVPFLLFGHDKCERPTVKEVITELPKFCKFVKTVNPKKVMVGEPIIVELEIKNLSRHHVDQLRIHKETKKGAFLTFGDEIMECGRLAGRQTNKFSYRLIPIRPGTLHIPASRITQFIMWPLNDRKPIIIPQKAGLSNSIKVEVVPVGISVKHLPAKSKTVLGERVDIDLEIKNSSAYDVENFQARLDYNSGDYVQLKELPKKGRVIKSGQRIILPYSVMPVSEGKKIIVAKIKNIKFSEKENVFFPTWSTSLSEKMILDVDPVRLSVFVDFDKTDLKLMEKVRSVLTVMNRSKVIIEGFEHKFLGDFASLRLVSSSANEKSLFIPPGECRSVESAYHAEKAGAVRPGKVALTNLKMNGVWLSGGKGIFASSTVPALHIRPLRLPGYKKPVSIICPALETYYDQFTIRVLLTAVIILVLIALFRFLLNCFIVEYMVGKFILTLFIATFLSQGMLVLLTGCAWFWRTMPPPVLDLAAIFAGSVCLSFLFGMFAVKSLAIGSTLSGIAIFASSYLLYTGYRTYQLQGFSNYPLSASLILMFLTAWAILLWIFRKY